MGTRGITGIVIDGKEKINYQQHDSYPEGVGAHVLHQLRDLMSGDTDELYRKARALVVVDRDTPITDEAIEACRQYTDTGVGHVMRPDGSIDDSLNWYQLTRGTQGDLEAMLDCGYVEDHSEFPLDGLFCEWGYLVDLDKGVFQVYVGFQETLPKRGRWAGRPTKREDRQRYDAHLKWCEENDRKPWEPSISTYKAVEMVAEWPLHQLPGDDEFFEALARTES